MGKNLPAAAVLECMPNRVTAVVFIAYFSTATEHATKDAPPTLAQANSFRNANDRIAT